MRSPWVDHQGNVTVGTEAGDDPPEEEQYRRCVLLFRAVVLQAFRDACQDVGRVPTKPRAFHQWKEAVAERDEAREWLLEPSEDQDKVCTMACLDGATVRKAAHRLRLNGWPPLPKLEPEQAVAHPHDCGANKALSRYLRRNQLMVPRTAKPQRIGFANQNHSKKRAKITRMNSNPGVADVWQTITR
jgi:hypothetical protein